MLHRVHYGLVPARDNLTTAEFSLDRGEPRRSDGRRDIYYVWMRVYVPSGSRSALERLCSEPKTRPDGLLGGVIELWERGSNRLAVFGFVLFLGNSPGG